MAKALVVGNWKAYVSSLKEAKQIIKDIEKKLPRDLRVDVVICPPHTFLQPLASGYKGKRIKFGAQDGFFEGGAHTGEISVQMLKDSGAKYVIVGHAERRARGENDEEVAKKVGAVLDAKLTPVICFGERERDKDAHYLASLEMSILGSLALVDINSLKKVVLAYEPVWAIGAPLPPSARTIRESMIFIRKTLAQKYHRADALKVRVIYGGAVNAESVDELVTESDSNGFLPGRASVDADAFATIIKAYHQ